MTAIFSGTVMVSAIVMLSTRWQLFKGDDTDLIYLMIAVLV